jgi:hypothetical protein
VPDLLLSDSPHRCRLRLGTLRRRAVDRRTRRIRSRPRKSCRSKPLPPLLLANPLSRSMSASVLRGGTRRCVLAPSIPKQAPLVGRFHRAGSVGNARFRARQREREAALAAERQCETDFPTSTRGDGDAHGVSDPGRAIDCRLKPSLVRSDCDRCRTGPIEGEQRLWATSGHRATAQARLTLTRATRLCG